jgi:hypothetical protein
MGCVLGELKKRRGHWMPQFSSEGVVRGVAVAGAVGDPAEVPAVCHGDGHGVAAGDDHLAKGRGDFDGCDGFEKDGSLVAAESAKEGDAFC